MNNQYTLSTAQHSTMQEDICMDLKIEIALFSRVLNEHESDVQELISRYKKTGGLQHSWLEDAARKRDELNEIIRVKENLLSIFS